MRESEALDLFVEELGADLSVYIRPGAGEWGRMQRLLSQVAANDVESDTPPVPYEWSQHRGDHVKSDVVLLWDRPTPTSAGHRTLLRRILAGYGVDPGVCSNLWAYPHALTSPPLAPQVAAYRDATFKAIEASGARYVVLVGLPSVHLWRPELKLGQVSGRVAVMESKWFVFPIANPMVALTDQTLMHEYRETLSRLSEVVQHDMGMEEFGIICAEPGCTDDYTTSSGAYVYDPDGVPWCRDHFRKAHKRRLAHRGKNTQRYNSTLQEGLGI